MATSMIQKTVTRVTLSSSTDTSASYLSGYWGLRRVGSIVFLETGDLKAMPAGSFTETVKTIPVDFRPNANAVFTLVKRNPSPTPIAMRINNTGEIIFYNYGSATSAATPWNQTVCWPIEI